MVTDALIKLQVDSPDLAGCPTTRVGLVRTRSAHSNSAVLRSSWRASVNRGRASCARRVLNESGLSHTAGATISTNPRRRRKVMTNTALPAFSRSRGRLGQSATWSIGSAVLSLLQFREATRDPACVVGAEPNQTKIGCAEGRSGLFKQSNAWVCDGDHHRPAVRSISPARD
jgi:hypothetical protein